MKHGMLDQFSFRKTVLPLQYVYGPCSRTAAAAAEIDYDERRFLAAGNLAFQFSRICRVCFLSASHRAAVKKSLEASAHCIRRALIFPEIIKPVCFVPVIDPLIFHHPVHNQDKRYQYGNSPCFQQIGISSGNPDQKGKKIPVRCAPAGILEQHCSPSGRP